MLQFLLTMYYPFVAGVITCSFVLLGLLCYLGRQLPCSTLLLIIIILSILSTIIHVLIACRVLFQKIKMPKNPLEIKLSRESNGIIYQWVDDIAEKNDLVPPDEIRLGADALAHVYETPKGKNILVLGGMAVATFTKRALSGIVAHELAHFTFGDTAFARAAARKVALMEEMDKALLSSGVGLANPLAWVLIAYHYFVFLAFAQLRREQEYEADCWEVAHAGKDVAAASLIHIHVTSRMPWARLANIVDSNVSMGQRVHKDIFEEQYRRAKSEPKMEWERLMKKELKEPTRAFDSHPALKERLEEIGVTPKRALELALSMEGEPATNLFPAWESIQKELSERLNYIAFQRREAIDEAHQILRRL